MFSRIAFYSPRHQAFIHTTAGKKPSSQPAEKTSLREKKTTARTKYTLEPTKQEREEKMCEGGKNKNSNKKIR